MNKYYFVFGLLFLTLLAGCTTQEMPGQDLPEQPDPNEAPDEEMENMSSENTVDRTIEVRGGNYYFNPDTIEVSQGETVRFEFINEGGSHDFVIPSLDIGTSVISGGETESFTYTFDETGTFDFECTVPGHASRGMVGEITVS